MIERIPLDSRCAGPSLSPTILLVCLHICKLMHYRQANDSLANGRTSAIEQRQQVTVIMPKTKSIPCPCIVGMLLLKLMLALDKKWDCTCVGLHLVRK